MVLCFFMKSFLVGAYTAVPGLDTWNAGAEREFIAMLGGDERVSGLEIPFFGFPHARDLPTLLPVLPKKWANTLTCIPGTMERLKTDRAFGLASSDEAGRTRAVSFAKEACESVRCFQSAGGVIRAVQIQSAPRQGPEGAKASADAFSRSLSELRSWDWNGAELLVEHCDAYFPKAPFIKGFLPLSEEVIAIRGSTGKTPIGILINWGRSAIEERNPETPGRHAQIAGEAGLLRGVMFSGASDKDPVYGGWKDLHAPFSSWAPGSLLTEEVAGDTLAMAGEVAYIGLKIQPMGVKALSLPARFEAVRDGLSVLSRIA